MQDALEKAEKNNIEEIEKLLLACQSVLPPEKVTSVTVDKTAFQFTGLVDVPIALTKAEAYPKRRVTCKC